MTEVTTKLEAAAFRMNLAGFCRNCLSRWYEEAAAENNINMSKEEAREIFYGMPFSEWKKRYQLEDTIKITNSDH